MDIAIINVLRRNISTIYCNFAVAKVVEINQLNISKTLKKE